MDDKHNPFAILDNYIHKLVVAGSHFLQRNFHLNRDHLIAFCVCLYIACQFVCTWLRLQHIASTAADYWLLRLVAHGLVDALLLLFLAYGLRARLDMSKEFENDPVRALTRLAGKDRGEGTVFWLPLRWIASAIGPYKLAELSLLAYGVVANGAEFGTAELKSVSSNSIIVLGTVIMHLVDSDHVHPDKRTSIDTGDVQERT